MLADHLAANWEGVMCLRMAQGVEPGSSVGRVRSTWTKTTRLNPPCASVCYRLYLLSGPPLAGWYVAAFGTTLGWAAHRVDDSPDANARELRRMLAHASIR